MGNFGTQIAKSAGALGGAGPAAAAIPKSIPALGGALGGGAHTAGSVSGVSGSRRQRKFGRQVVGAGHVVRRHALRRALLKRYRSAPSAPLRRARIPGTSSAACPWQVRAAPAGTAAVLGTASDPPSWLGHRPPANDYLRSLARAGGGNLSPPARSALQGLSRVAAEPGLYLRPDFYPHNGFRLRSVPPGGQLSRQPAAGVWAAYFCR